MRPILVALVFFPFQILTAFPHSPSEIQQLKDNHAHHVANSGGRNSSVADTVNNTISEQRLSILEEDGNVVKGKKTYWAYNFYRV